MQAHAGLLVSTSLASLLVAASTVRADDFPFPTRWERILECDGGAAHVDVNAYERRMLQLVVTDVGIVRYLQAHGAGPTDLDKLETVIPGRADAGVFRPQDFGGFLNKGCADDGCYYKIPSSLVFRQGAGLRFRRVMDAHKTCIDWRPNDYYCAQWRDVPEAEIASWTFQHCE